MIINCKKVKNIRNKNYTHLTSLETNNFQKAWAGHKATQKLIATSFGIIVTSLSSVIPVVSGQLFAYLIVWFGLEKNYSFIFIVVSILVYFLALVLLISLGFEVRAVSLIIMLILTSVISTLTQTDAKPGGVILFLILSIVLAWLGATLTALCLNFTYVCSKILGEFLAILGSGLITVVSIALIITTQEPKPGEGIISIIAALSVILTGAIIARQAVRGSPKFAWITEKAIFWAATGGTSFYGVDLTDACFDGADLPHTDFRKANLTRASFEEATGLDLARLQGTILEQPKVRKLLINKRGCNEDYTASNFNGANLRRADLTGANLKEVNALDADFSGAILTDACIQGWNINKNTRFTNVVCERIYLKCARKGNIITLSEPKPDSGIFKPGEFEKWISEIHETIDLIFREGLNWRAFIFSLAQTAIDHEGLDLSRYTISRKDEGIVFAEIGTFPGADKKAIHEAFTSCYESAVKAIEEKYQLVLQAKEGELERLREFIESKHQIIRELMSIAVGTGRKVLIQGEGHRVYMLNQAGEIMETKNEGFSVGGNISIGGDNMSLTGANLSLGELSGQVTNTIQQLQGVNAAGGNDLVKILTALQESIQGDSALSDNQKKDALEAVETIAEEAKKPPEDRVIKLCSMAVNALKGVASAVTDASKLAEVLKTYLPTLTGILGI
ncbi:pentapeptide repeat-containing protein [Funiculus sociatus GB2-A5]|uniref:Pentapeptide repeat-containing protein n=1 Tax=Funiculus sociatus GB2-A5 TaxID=2933946 RepID=A0ABV0JTZ0_9CYAN|nr:pentapeptide repeat-containing protein [Trichocoleus sp. FACHB-6]MBD2061495.1 pentapeptide repeat-containing protein [Trichocoleus sp. FACHB-6]